MNKYKILNKEFKGINIIGYTILNEEGKTKLVKLQDMIKLARVDKLEDTHAVFDASDASFVLHYIPGIVTLENSDRSNGVNLKLTARIISENKCIGYKAIDNNTNKNYKLSIEKVWELAEQGSIIGVKGTYINNKKTLISDSDNKLIDLPKIVNN